MGLGVNRLFNLASVRALHFFAMFFESFFFSEMIAPVVRRILRARVRPKSVLFLMTDPGVWRLGELISHLRTMDYDCRIGVAAFGHSELSTRRSRSLIDSIDPKGPPAKLLRFFSLDDFVWMHSFQYVVFNHPYALLNAPGSIRSLTRASTTIYTPYTVGVMSNPYHGNFGGKVLQYASRICVETSFIAKEVGASASWASSRLSVVGSPGINGNRFRDNPSTGSNVSMGILFAPHWTPFTSAENFRSSRIIELTAGLGSIHALWPDFPMTLRLHPRLLESLATFLPEGLDALKWSWMRSSSSANPLDDFNFSKILITNSASFVGEFPFTEKPLVFWKEGSEVLPLLNEFGRECLSVNYICDSKETLVDTVSELLAGQDPKLESRLRFIQRIRKEFDGKTFEELVTSLIR